ncbi:MAG: iron-sulfur cluster assembly accessory protein [Fimbriimonadales bacterium]
MEKTDFPVQLTERALLRIQQILKKQGREGDYLRIGVRSGGCSGFEYVMMPTQQVRPDDLTAEFDGIRVVIDPKSAKILAGTTIDYTGQLIGGGFQFHNPNAKRQCGCGTSFSV